MFVGLSVVCNGGSFKCEFHIFANYFLKCTESQPVTAIFMIDILINIIFSQIFPIPEKWYIVIVLNFLFINESR